MNKEHQIETLGIESYPNCAEIESNDKTEISDDLGYIFTSAKVMVLGGRSGP